MMSELQEHHSWDYPYGLNELIWQARDVDLDVKIVDQDTRSPKQEVVDTAVVMAPDDRGTEPLATTDVGNKKPPVDPPETMLASPDDFPEEGNGKGCIPVALGEIAVEEFSAPFEEEDLYADLRPNLELVRGESDDLIINRGHSNQALVDHAVTQLTDGSAWHESEQDQYPERIYHVDDPKVPALFAKTTMFAFDAYRNLSDSVNEMVMSQDVKAVIDSEQAQQAAREHGFDGITFVEPLVMAVSTELDAAVTVYPRQYGQLTPLADIWELEVPEDVAQDELDRVNAVLQDMHALLGANGIVAPDLGAPQVLIEDNTLALVDVEEYFKFETPEAAMEPAETAHFKDDQWHAGNDPTYDNPESIAELAVVEQGAIGIGRGTNSAEDSPEFSTEWHGDGTVATLWNAVTKEAALVHVSNFSDWEPTISQVFARVPNLSGQGTILHVLAVDTRRALGRLFDAVAVRNTVSLEGYSDIYLSTSTGSVEVYDRDGNQVYRYQPPSTREAE